MHRIFLLPELLIQIISFLPPSDLRTCASVSRHWKETLRLNLHPRNLPLPDTLSPHDHATTQPHRLKKLPQLISSLAQDILFRTSQWQNAGGLSDISDDYYFWHEGAHRDLLSALSQYLHPWLGKHMCELVGGLNEIAQGDMGICVRSKLTTAEFDEWFLEGKRKMGEMEAYLTRPVTRSVEVYCVEGAMWDPEYGNVLHRGVRRQWQQRCVKIERERGIRIGDVIDELRGMLRTVEVVAGSEEEAQGEVLLEWRFEDAATRMMCFEWLDSTG
ncbi:hypothetical protein G6011_04500 [Alternaria panax]|uniref:F-box domain-containing protein n=1 Tax=Alternaria panax TaxID=48097 RepID=A0AAD4IHA1_9PLEO|nr:hypothetical protein G6011_04500 [Alternaria panax]